MITRSDIAAHLERGIRTGWLLARGDYSRLTAAFVGERPSDGAFEDYADLGTTPWPLQRGGTLGASGTHGEPAGVKAGDFGAGAALGILVPPAPAIPVTTLDSAPGIAT